MKRVDARLSTTSVALASTANALIWRQRHIPMGGARNCWWPKITTGLHPPRFMFTQGTLCIRQRAREILCRGQSGFGRSPRQAVCRGSPSAKGHSDDHTSSWTGKPDKAETLRHLRCVRDPNETANHVQVARPSCWDRLVAALHATGPIGLRWVHLSVSLRTQLI